MAISLDKIDKRILEELDKDARISNAELGRIVRKSREAVKYRIAQLEEKGVLQGFITSINPNKLGYHMFKVYIKLENIPQEREKFFEELKKDKDTYWIGISDGAFDCVVAILSKNTLEYFAKINRLLAKWKHLIISKVLGTMVDTNQYNKKFFTQSREGLNVVFGGEVVNNEIDHLDSILLEILANNARISVSELARKANSTIEIVRGRMRRLEQKGIILGYRTAVDFNKLGMEFYKAIIYCRGISTKEEQSLYEWMKSHPSSIYFIRSLAPWEYELEFAVTSYQEFNRIINEIRQKYHTLIKNYEHLIMISETWMPAYKEMLKATETR